MESNVRERQGSEQCQDMGDEAMGEPGNLPCAQKGELPGFIGARANTGFQPTRSASLRVRLNPTIRTEQDTVSLKSG